MMIVLLLLWRYCNAKYGRTSYKIVVSKNATIWPLEKPSE